MKCSHLVLIACCLRVLPAQADFNAILWDNDVLSPRNSDAYYTNGFIFHHVVDPVPPARGRAWPACPGLATLSGWLAPRLLPAGAGARYRHSWEIGQIIETPLDKQADPPDPRDQPYAGLLYAGCNYHVQTGGQAESLGLQFGVVGPLSLAEPSQDLAHRMVGGDRAMGWSAQLRNEPVVNLRYDRQQVLTRVDLGGFGLSVFDNLDLALGPLQSSASVGLNLLYAGNPEAVFGLNPNYLGRYPLLSHRRALGFYALAGGQAALVARNLFLDGNTWVDGPRVERRPLVGAAQLLIGYGFSCWAVQLGLNVSTRTFETQALRRPAYGTLALTWGCR